MRITFETSNAAFEEDKRGECARIIRAIADKLEAGEYTGNVRDVNGNKIGTWHYGPTPLTGA